MKKDRTIFEIVAKPLYRGVACPVHNKYMVELRNGWFGNPCWWCKDCKKPYQLELHAMKNWNQDAVDTQLETNDQN